MDLTKINRLEVIEPSSGRMYVGFHKHVEVILQDDGRTLKLFVKDREGPAPQRKLFSTEQIEELAKLFQSKKES